MTPGRLGLLQRILFALSVLSLTDLGLAGRLRDAREKVRSEGQSKGQQRPRKSQPRQHVRPQPRAARPTTAVRRRPPRRPLR